ncbi:DUF2786 domain-containing protein [Chelatococcus sp. XZ-Ab1]|uniref:DUF7168 domain-containing protein n=1 Tax=Chelatococcus sp. XZ-Ab1 TaxID=3034027 RepID=UPI0023E39D03|nr:DUF2786 domain-containing protein [Chelatococcus sp. XZ-Ab1]
MKADLVKIRARLQALRNMTTANGCTEAEALAAAEKAAELLAANNLAEVDLDAPTFEELSVALGARRTPLDKVWQAVALFADCKGYLKRSGNRWQFCYFGRSSDVLVAEYVHEVIRRACETAIAEFRRSEAYRKRRKPKTRADAVRAFSEGLGEAITRKVVEGLWRRITPSGEARSWALVEARRAPLDEALRAQGARLRDVKPIGKARGRSRHEAIAAGYRAGRTVDVAAGLDGTARSDIAGLLT